MTEEELITLVQAELKGAADDLETDDYPNAVDDAERDTGWTLPVTSSFQITWIKRRTKRHLYVMLRDNAASEFKFEQINSQHIFDHYSKLVDNEDKAFDTVKIEQANEFSGVSAIHLFGTKIDAGFAYDSLGQDRTYDDDNVVIIHPSDTD